MPWNLLILPLVAGYYIFTRSYIFKFKQQRLDRQRLVFESVIWGVAVSLLTYIVRLIYESLATDELQRAIYNLIPLKTPYIGTTFCTLLLAVLLTEGINLVFIRKKSKFIQRAIKDIGNEFELLLKSSFTDNVLLLFTLDNDKVYVAWVKELPIPSVSKYVRIIPAISGYRDVQKNVVFTTHYLSVYAQYIQEGKAKSIEELGTDLIINTDDIITVNFFDNDMYKRFNSIDQ